MGGDDRGRVGSLERRRELGEGSWNSASSSTWGSWKETSAPSSRSRLMICSAGDSRMSPTPAL